VLYWREVEVGGRVEQQAVVECGDGVTYEGKKASVEMLLSLEDLQWLSHNALMTMDNGVLTGRRNRGQR
jgi:hypothetical protein